MPIATFLVALAMLGAPTPHPASNRVAVYRETPINSPNMKYYFSIRSAPEAAQFGWMLAAVAFEAFGSAEPGTVPVYCETPIGNEHGSYKLSTRSEPEAERAGWKRLFIAFYAYPHPSPGAVPIYEESQTSPLLGLQYNYASRSPEEAQQYAWSRGEIAFWVPTSPGRE